MNAAVSATSRAAARIQTAVAKARRPDACTGRVTAAVATMPVPITEANQLGVMWANIEARRGGWAHHARWNGRGAVSKAVSGSRLMSMLTSPMLPKPGASR
ncbi:hypothetical protein [Mycolicibacterium smegmatis]|uniref:hypothetical protein n=1 Tax=Mycolicibacterium smegmatis TaxID=1772 RepID=UPI002E25DC71